MPVGLRSSSITGGGVLKSVTFVSTGKNAGPTILTSRSSAGASSTSP